MGEIGATVNRDGVNASAVLFDFSKLADTGVLWLINRAVFHPRGFALAIDGNKGWSLQAADTGECYSFDLPEGVEDARFQAIEQLLADTRRFGHMPPLPDRPVEDAEALQQPRRRRATRHRTQS